MKNVFIVKSVKCRLNCKVSQFSREKKQFLSTKQPGTRAKIYNHTILIRSYVELNKCYEKNNYMDQQLDVLDIKFDVITNEYKWCPVLHLLERSRFSHTSHGLIESFTRLLAFSKCIVKETHELQGSFVI